MKTSTSQSVHRAAGIIWASQVFPKTFLSHLSLKAITSWNDSLCLSHSGSLSHLWCFVKENPSSTHRSVGPWENLQPYLWLLKVKAKMCVVWHTRASTTRFFLKKFYLIFFSFGETFAKAEVRYEGRGEMSGIGVNYVKFTTKSINKRQRERKKGQCEPSNETRTWRISGRWQGTRQSKHCQMKRRGLQKTGSETLQSSFYFSVKDEWWTSNTVTGIKKKTLKDYLPPGVVAHTYIARTPGPRQNEELQGRLGYTVRVCLKTLK